MASFFKLNFWLETDLASASTPAVTVLSFYFTKYVFHSCKFISIITLYFQAQANFERAEITIQSLEQKIKALTQSDNARRLQQQNESIIKDLKLRHHKEVLKYKEDIDKLQENFNDKVS